MTLITQVGSAVRHGAQALTRLGLGLHSHVQEAGGFKIAYDEGGKQHDSTVLLIHGFSADRDVWTRFVAGLRDRHVLIPDLPGHGQTPFVAGAGYSAPAQADRLVALLDALGIERVHVIGNSMGGFIAATLAHRAPERVISLGLVDAAGLRVAAPSALSRMLDEGRNPFLLDNPGQFDAFYAMTMAKQPFVPGIVRRAIAHEYVARRAQLAEIFSDFNQGSDMLDDRLSEISAPTWVAWGRHDQLIDASTAKVYADGIPRASLTIYEDLGHMPMFEAPRRSSRDYRAFLTQLAAAAPA
jgi:abhydrolase domain-containing protein 6